MIFWIILGLYILALSYIFLFSLGQLHLVLKYLQSLKKGEGRNTLVQDPAIWPMVTVQLPIYNEKYVVERLLESIVALEYPEGKLEIQILDDSTDETSELLKDIIKNIKSPYSIHHIQRTLRSGYKAGALGEALKKARGEFIAIFDSDFIPKPDFLYNTIPHFDENTGVVQTRWGHLNEDYSLLTRLQAFGLDAHFTVEQGGRNFSGSFINFNGTGGVWRKKCIEDAGGWSDDTLTEDLDLSYRAQLKGWKFRYLENCVAPAELPILMPAIKSQQYRWNKGAAETARKNLGKVFRAKLKLSTKMHAFFHLLNSMVFICLLLASVLSVPVLYYKVQYPEYNLLFYIGSIFLLGFFSIAFFYLVSSKRLHPKNGVLYFLRTFPMFLLVSMGLSFHNGLAVFEGLIGKKTPFVRTPKFNLKNNKDSWKTNKYIKLKFSFSTLMEAFLAIYFSLAIVYGIVKEEPGLLIFHFMLALGFGLVFVQSVKPLRNAAN